MATATEGGATRADVDEAAAKLDAEQAALDREDGKTPDGQSIEDMAAAGEDDDGQLALLDFGGTLNLAVRGKKPTGSELKVKAISRDISGQLGDTGDDEVGYALMAYRLDKVEFVTKRDGDGRVIDKVRRHVVNPINFVPVDPTTVADLIG